MPFEPLWDKGPDDLSLSQLQNDDAAFEIFFRNHFTILCAYCQFKYSFDLDSAKEAVHTGFIKLWENRQSIAPGSSVKAYLYKIVSNTCLDLIKHRKVKQQHEKYVIHHSSQQNTLHYPDFTDLKSLKEIIDQTVSEMPPQMRRVFELSRYEGLKYAQIANLLNLSVNTVETQIHRALLKLKKKLSMYGSLSWFLIMML